MSEEGGIETAMLRLAGAAKPSKGGISGELDTIVESVKSVPWTALNDLKKDPHILRKIDEATSLLRSLRDTLSS
jgi:ParB family transcriptional regulator, chromosome partitioning protein